MMVAAGRLRHRVTLQRPTRSTNDYGERERSYAAVGTARRAAYVEGATGRETQRANQSVAEASHTVTVRADSTTRALTTDDRVVWHDLSRDRTLGIVHVDTSKAQADGEIVLLCEEKP